MTNRVNPRTSAKPQPDEHALPELVAELNTRMSNVERVVLGLQATMTPKWVRYAGWGTFVGACIKVLVCGVE